MTTVHSLKWIYVKDGGDFCLVGSGEQFAKELVKYIRYYNNDRIKLRLNGKSPVQYRALFQSKSAS